MRKFGNHVIVRSAAFDNRERARTKDKQKKKKRKKERKETKFITEEKNMKNSKLRVRKMTNVSGHQS